MTRRPYLTMCTLCALLLCAGMVDPAAIVEHFGLAVREIVKTSGNSFFGFAADEKSEVDICPFNEPFDEHALRALYMKGCSDALHDIYRGELKLRGIFGKSFNTKAIRTFRNRYNIEVILDYPGCDFRLDEYAYVGGYNAVSTKAVEAKYGTGVIDQVMIESGNRSLDLIVQLERVE